MIDPNPLLRLAVLRLFEKLSPVIEESAYIDGAGRFTAFLRIVLPISGPVI